MHRTNGTTFACASCKHQRKRCTEKCLLAPFFPAHKTHEFQAVHKVFGVSNITKIINDLPEQDRKLAVDSLVWEAMCRKKDRVLGPLGEYRRVCEELRIYKHHFQQAVAILERNNNNKVVNINGRGVINISSTSSNNVNNNTNFIDNNKNNVVHVNGNSIVDYCPYSCVSQHNIQDDGEILRGEDEIGLVLPQQPLTRGFDQQCFLTGQYDPIDSKFMKSTLWEGSS